MHGFYFAKVGSAWVQTATDTSRPLNEYQYPPPPIDVPIALAAGAGVSPNFYVGYTMISNLFPQYKEGSAAYWLDVWELDLYNTNTGVAANLTALLTDAAATLPNYGGGTVVEITDGAFQPFVAALFWQDLVGCTEV